MNRQGSLIAVGLVVAAGVLIFALVQISSDDRPGRKARSDEDEARSDHDASVAHRGSDAREGPPEGTGGPRAESGKVPERPVREPVDPSELPPVQESLAERAEADLHLDDLPGLPDAVAAQESELHKEIYRLWGMTDDATDGEFAGQFHRAETLLERMYEDVGDDPAAKKALAERNTKLRELMAKRMPY